MKIVLLLGVLICLKVFPRLVIADGTPKRSNSVSAMKPGGRYKGIDYAPLAEQRYKESLAADGRSLSRKDSIDRSPSKSGRRSPRRGRTDRSVSRSSSRASSPSSSPRSIGGESDRSISRSSSRGSSPSKRDLRRSSSRLSRSSSIGNLDEDLVIGGEACSMDAPTKNMFQRLIKRWTGNKDEHTMECFKHLFKVLNKFGLPELANERLTYPKYKRLEWQLVRLYEVGKEVQNFIVEPTDFEANEMNKLGSSDWHTNEFQVGAEELLPGKTPNEKMERACVVQCGTMYGYFLTPVSSEDSSAGMIVVPIVKSVWNQNTISRMRNNAVASIFIAPSTTKCECKVKESFIDFLNRISADLPNTFKNNMKISPREAVLRLIDYMQKVPGVNYIEHKKMIQLFTFKILKNVKLDVNNDKEIWHEIESAQDPNKITPKRQGSVSGSLSRRGSMRGAGFMRAGSMRGGSMRGGSMRGGK